MSPAARAQTSAAFTACSQGTLANCALIKLTSDLGAGPGATNLFRIAVANLGSQTAPLMATSIYNLVFATGQSSADLGADIDLAAPPVSLGGASVTDPTEWDLFDSGDFIFLSAFAGNGVGNCIAALPIGGFGQAGNTCDDGQFLAFDLFTSRVYDPNAFVLADLEVVGLTDDLPADSCNDATPCMIATTPVTATPEPGSLCLVAPGIAAVLALSKRRKVKSGRPLSCHDNAWRCFV